MKRNFDIKRADDRSQAAQRHVQNELASFFQTLPWTWYITATFDRELSKQHSWQLLSEYIDEVECTRRCPLAALIVQETKSFGLGKVGSDFRFHLLLRAPTNVSAHWLKELWALPRYGGSWCRQRAIKPCSCEQCEGGAMRVCPYDCNGNAATYLFKDVDANPDGWRLHREHLLGLRLRSWHTPSRIRRSVHRHEQRQSFQRTIK